MSRKKQNRSQRGRSERKEHFLIMHRSFMEEHAWRALSTTAQALYPWLKLEWKGLKFNNNGRLSLSYQQAAKRLGVKSTDTIAKAFQDLQAKGFIVVHEMAHLGFDGHGKSFCFEITELKMPGSEDITGRQLYKKWQLGKEFEMVKARANNPTGKNKSPS